MKKSKIIGFVATRSRGAREFYEKILGLTFVSDDPFAIVFEVGAEVEASNRVASSQGTGAGMGSGRGDGIMLRVQKVEELVPARHTVLGWEVADIREAVGELTVKGLRFEKYKGLEQDELGVWTSPAGGKIAWFRDPDGNILSLTEFAREGKG